MAIQSAISGRLDAHAQSMVEPQRSGIASDLRRILGSGSVADQPASMSRYTGDALGSFRAFRAADRLGATPSVVVFPESAQQISRVLRYAQRQGVPVVPYGGGTGVFGAAAPIEGCVVLSLDRMNRILDISPQDFTARLQAGVVLDNAARALHGKSMLLGHDPWSRPIATVGGAISTDGVGYTAARYGSMGEQALGLEAVLADGEIIRERANIKPTNGLPLKHLLIGMEGTFGVVSEATLRVFPQPQTRLIAGVDFPTFEAGFLAICRLYAEGVRPTMIDYGTEADIANSSEFNSSTIDEDATLYIAFEGFSEDVRTQWQKTLDICREYDGIKGSREEALAFWQNRHAPGERYKRNVLQSASPAEARRDAASARMDYLHVALPISRVLDYRKRCMGIFAQRDIQVCEWSIWARPEFLSFLIMQEQDAQTDDYTGDMGQVVDAVLSLAQRMGGAMEYCHGVGLKLAHLAEAEHGSGLYMMRRLKRVIDPNNILNPGKLLG